MKTKHVLKSFEELSAQDFGREEQAGGSVAVEERTTGPTREQLRGREGLELLEDRVGFRDWGINE